MRTLTHWATFWLNFVQQTNNVPIVHSKSEVVVTNPYASARGSFDFCHSCIQREAINAVGFGIDLASTYGTASYHYQNGTVVDIGRVEGSKEYIEMMERLALPPAPKDPIFERVKSGIHELQQFLNFSDASLEINDIDTLSTMIRSFYEPAALKGKDFTVNLGGVISMPYLPSLVESDLRKAARKSEFILLESYKHWGSPHNFNAAWAGMGYGLCENWRDIVACEKEEKKIKEQHAFVISLTKKELRLQNALAWNAHAITNLGIKEYKYLGSDQVNTYPNATYWDEVRARIVETVKEGGMKAEKIIVMGEGAEGHQFEKTLWQVLNDLDMKELYSGIQVSQFNATYLAARGAAGLAKRWQAETWDCVEKASCYGH